jgi:type IV pilus assembly protein PilV
MAGLLEMSRQCLDNLPGYPQKTRGFTLIEVLITMAVLSIGLAGLVAMEVLSYRKNHESYLRSQAILQAHEMAARMHANPAGVKAGDYCDISGSGENPPTRNCLDSASTSISAAAATNCSAADIAAFDADEWLSSTASMLPSGAGSVSGPCPPPTSTGIYTITISWLEGSSADDTDNENTTRIFRFEFRPLP